MYHIYFVVLKLKFLEIDNESIIGELSTLNETKCANHIQSVNAQPPQKVIKILLLQELIGIYR